MDWHARFLWRRALMISGALLLTAAAYFASSGLHRIWWLVWVAPLPVLLLVHSLRAWQALAVAFAARALAGLNFWSYNRHVVQLPFWLSVGAILVPAAWFALAVVFHRALLGKGRMWLAAMVFPVTMVAAEFLISLSQGTFLSTGYTQLENLPILQVASITGLWGISFLVNLFPAGLAVVTAAKGRPRIRMAAFLIAVYACVLCYGLMRLKIVPKPSDSVVVGLVEVHSGQDMFPSSTQATMNLMQNYAAQVPQLAARGAQFVVFPEMSALVPDPILAEVDAIFERAARVSNVQILLGVLHPTTNGTYNEGRLYGGTGQIETVYRKHHPVPTWEARTTPGTGTSVLACPRPRKGELQAVPPTSSQSVGKIGIEICRDMDYTELARRYAQQRVGLLLVPAWDQGMDADADWHGHLSVMRGVEDGFAIVRDAKNGLLTASDDRGRIVAEIATRSDGDLVTMIARVPVRHDATLYEKWGDWFAWIDLASLGLILVLWWSSKLRGEEALPANDKVRESNETRGQENAVVISAHPYSITSSSQTT